MTTAATLARPTQLLLLVAGVVALACAAMLPSGPWGPLGRPDPVYALVAAWVLRTPKPLAPALLAGLGLFADLMLSRPAGLGALGLLFVAELLRSRSRSLRALPFPVEWLAVVACQAAMLFGMRLVLHLSFSEVPNTGDLLRCLAATALVYPPIARLVGRILQPSGAAAPAARGWAGGRS